MAVTRLFNGLGVFSRRALRADVKNAGRRRSLFALTIARTSARLSHLTFAGLALVAMTPSVRGAIEDVAPVSAKRQAALHAEPASESVLAPERRRNNTSVALDVNPTTLVDVGARPPAIVSPTPNANADDRSPIVPPVKRQPPRIVALATPDTVTSEVARTELRAADVALWRGGKKHKSLKRLFARTVPAGRLVEADPAPKVTLSSLGDVLPIVRSEPPPRRLLRVHRRGRDGPAEVTTPREAHQKVAAVSEEPTPLTVRPITSVNKGVRYTVVPAWSERDIGDAKRVCGELLSKGHVIASEAPAVREGACGAPAPVEVRKVGTPEVTIRPSVMLTCPMAAALDRWMTEVVQPAALETFGSPVVKLASISSYSCRNRYSRTEGKLSEHALVNAIDLSGFVLRDGRTVKVLGGWGRVARDKRASDTAVASEDAPKNVKVADAKIVGRPPDGASMLGAGRSHKDGTKAAKSESGSKTEKAASASGEGANDNDAKDGRATEAPAAHEAKAAKPEPSEKDKHSAFLHKVHSDACALFGTVLGPEANDAHRNHFHLDMKARRGNHGYCQ